MAYRAMVRYQADGLIDRAPGIAYYGVLSLFPMLMIGCALLRLVGGPHAPDDVAAYAIKEGTSGAVADTLRSATQTAKDASAATAGSAGLIGFVALVYGASRALTAAGRALDVVAGVGSVPQRSPVRRAQDMALALAAAVRWAGPSEHHERFHLVTHGSVVTVAVVLLETRAFDYYVTHLATYNDTYGAFAGAVILMLWIWLTASAFLFGAEIDAVVFEDRHRSP